MNTYVSTLRAILVKYWNKRKKDAAEYLNKKNQGIYTDLHLNQLVSRLSDVAHSDYISALTEIDNVHKQCAQAVKKWGVLNGDDFVQADIALLNSGIPLTPDDFADIVERNINNATMCRLIGERVKAAKLVIRPATAEILASADPAVKMSAYEVIFTKARNVLGSGNSIDVQQLANQLKANYTAVIDHRFETFCDPEQHPEFAECISVVGEGTELA